MKGVPHFKSVLIRIDGHQQNLVFSPTPVPKCLRAWTWPHTCLFQATVFTAASNPNSNPDLNSVLTPPPFFFALQVGWGKLKNCEVSLLKIYMLKIA